MRLLSVTINEYRSVSEASLPLEGMVVLIGPNSAGKTTALEAVREALRAKGAVRVDPGDRDQPLHGAEVEFELPGAALAGSEDRQLLRDLLAGRYGPGAGHDAVVPPLAALDPEAVELLADCPLEEVTNYLVDEYVKRGNAGTPEDRRCLASALFDNPLFQTDFRYLVLRVDRARLGSTACAAAERIAQSDRTGPDALHNLAKEIVAQGGAFVASVSDQAPAVLANRVRVITLDTDPERLGTEVEAVLPSIHNLLWGTEAVPHPNDFLAQRGLEAVDEFLIGPTDSKFLEADPWVESQIEVDGMPTMALPTTFSPFDTGEWHRVRRSLLAVVRLISARVNEVAPSFVREYGRIEVELLPLSVWSSSNSRVRITVSEGGTGTPRDLAVLGSGIARWVSAAVRLASEELMNGERTVTGPSGESPIGPDERNAIITAARQDPLSQQSLHLVPKPNPSSVYLVDEPEAHLHPLAVRSVATWLGELAKSADVVVATHHPTFLDTSGHLAKLVRVTKEGHRTRLDPMRSPLQGLSEINDQFGLSRGELFLLTRLIVFVEGEHDRAMLEEWFGDQLADVAVRLIPLRGIDNLVGLPQYEIVRHLAIPIAVLADDADIIAVREGRSRSRGERAMADFLRQAHDYGVEVTLLGLSKPDILYYLDPAVCRLKAPHFPGWEEAWAAWRDAGKQGDWKKWVAREYGLGLDVPAIKELARDCIDKIPQEIHGKVRRLRDMATS